MKKMIAMLLIVGFVTVNLVGCGDTKTTKATDSKGGTQQTQQGKDSKGK